MSKPRFTTSCAALFEERGNPWLSAKDKDKDFPMSRSRDGTPPLQGFEAAREAIRNKLNEKFGKACLELTEKPSVNVNPDMDCFTQAARAEAKSIFRDPKGTPIEADFLRRKVNIAARMHRELNARKIIKVK